MDIVTSKQLNILIQLAEADKNFAASELAMIFQLAKDRNFPEEGVRALIKNPQPIGSLGALSYNQKLNYLYSCIDLIRADNVVAETELTFCKNIAIKLGFKKNVVDYLLENFDKKLTEAAKKAVFAEYM